MLNKPLYDTLIAMFGRVQIKKPGMPMRYKVSKNLEGRDIINHLTDKEEGGEDYAVCCPVCFDRRFRLYINHNFGMREPTTGKLFNHLMNMVHCFNEDCNVTEVVEEIKEQLGATSPATDGRVVYSGAPATQTYSCQDAPPHPGILKALRDLPSTHKAITYLTGRGFDIKELNDKYKVKYCVASPMRYVKGRIVIPMFKDSKIVGWQARYVGELPKKDTLQTAKVSGVVKDISGTGAGIVIFVNSTPHMYPEGVCPTVHIGDSVIKGTPMTTTVPKYWTSPGCMKSQHLYNMDFARKYPYAVVVEGPLDAIRFGDPAVAILGKKISSMQQRLLGNIWNTIVILLDPEAVKDMEYALTALRSCVHGNRVFSVVLSDGKDPGDCEREYLQTLIGARAKEAEVTLME